LRGRKPLGIVTDRAIVVEVVAKGLDPATLTACDVMTASPAVAGTDDDILWALKTMRDRGVRRLPVVDAGGELTADPKRLSASRAGGYFRPSASILRRMNAICVCSGSFLGHTSWQPSSDMQPNTPLSSPMSS